MSYLAMNEGKQEDHQYARAGRSVVVFKYEDGSWGCEYYENQLVDGEHTKVFISEERYEGKSESWAEDCADNYVFGIKNFEENQT